MKLDERLTTSASYVGDALRGVTTARQVYNCTMMLVRSRMVAFFCPTDLPVDPPKALMLLALN